MFNKKQVKTKREHVSVNEASETLQVSRETVINMINRGELQGFKKTLAINSPFRVYVDSIESLMLKREHQQK
jgi:hypothetical protein